MASEGSITRCLALLRQGEGTATQLIWERYFPQLVRLAHKQLADLSCRSADEEDIALSALDRFCRAAEQNRYPDLADRHGLWRLLLQITCAGCRIRFAMKVASGVARAMCTPRLTARTTARISTRSPTTLRLRSSPPWWPSSVGGSWHAWRIRNSNPGDRQNGRDVQRGDRRADGLFPADCRAPVEADSRHLAQ